MRQYIKAFWGCGDDQIIEFAITRAHLNRMEKEVIRLMLDECLTQEEGAEMLSISPRRFQEFWYSATAKLLSIPWVKIYGRELFEGYNKGN